MACWVFTQRTQIGEISESEPVDFYFEVDEGHWWSGEANQSDPNPYQEGDIAFLTTTDGDLRGWGTIVDSGYVGHIEADDDEEGVTPPFWVRNSWAVSVQPRVIFSNTLKIPDWREDLHSLSEVEARTINLAIRERSEPRIITFEYINPELIQELKRNPELIRSVHWRDFERVLARLLEEFGYEIDLQRGTKDGGVDLFALSRLGHPLGPHKYLLQAKRWKGSVGVAPVRELKFLHDHYGMTKSCLATTSRFTSGAWQLARQFSHQLELRDLEGIKRWINQAWNLDQL